MDTCTALVENKLDSSQQDTMIEECGICLTDKPLSAMVQLDSCSHRFCVDCWSFYLTPKITKDGMDDGLILCPSINCLSSIDQGVAVKLIGFSSAKSFEGSNQKHRWCPSPNCSKAVRVEPVNDSVPLSCDDCGFEFCLDCDQASHEPLKCSWLRRWLKEYNQKLILIQEEETEAYATEEQQKELRRILMNDPNHLADVEWLVSKECPSCNTPVERFLTGGNLVCKNPDCKLELCWYCLTRWMSFKDDSWFGSGCPRGVLGCSSQFKSKEGQDQDSSDEKSFDESSGEENSFDSNDDRYMTYHYRYQIHTATLEEEKRLSEVMEGEMMAHRDWITMAQLQKAHRVLRECRQTLICSCVFSYFLEPSNQATIFDQNLNDFEASTETFAMELKRLKNDGDFDSKAENLKSYCQRRRQTLLDHVKEGNEKGWWVAEVESQVVDVTGELQRLSGFSDIESEAQVQVVTCHKISVTGPKSQVPN